MTSQESMASVLLSTRANLPQHEYENCAVVFMHQRKASHNALFLQAISEQRSLSTTCVPHTELVRSLLIYLHRPA